MKRVPQYLSDLARYVSVLSEVQLVKYYFDGNKCAAVRALKGAEANGLVKLRVELVRARDTLSPIAILNSTEVNPPSEWIAYEACKRWSQEFKPLLTVQGSQKLHAALGGEMRMIAHGHVSHEIALTDVFLRKRESNPDFTWELFSTVSRGGGSRPDAIAGELKIELVGQYSGAAVAGKMSLVGKGNLEFW